MLYLAANASYLNLKTVALQQPTRGQIAAHHKLPYQYHLHVNSALEVKLNITPPFLTTSTILFFFCKARISLTTPTQHDATSGHVSALISRPQCNCVRISAVNSKFSKCLCVQCVSLFVAINIKFFQNLLKFIALDNFSRLFDLYLV